jgi:hypothetical protein
MKSIEVETNIAAPPHHVIKRLAEDPFGSWRAFKGDFPCQS